MIFQPAAAQGIPAGDIPSLYYSSLRAVSEREAWEEWIEYFLLGVARMSEDALSRTSRIHALVAQWRQRLSGETSQTPVRILDLLLANPFMTAAVAARHLGIAFTTAQRGIERLVRSEIIEPTNDARRNRVYCARQLLAILEEPAHLKPAAPE